MEDYKGDSSNNSTITSIAYLSINIDGHYQPAIYAYVAPQLGNSIDMILGTLWMQHQQVNVDSNRPRLQFIDGCCIKMNKEPSPMAIHRVNAAAIAAWIKQQRKDHRV
jgi:hypothetical protein